MASLHLLKEQSELDDQSTEIPDSEESPMGPMEEESFGLGSPEEVEARMKGMMEDMEEIMKKYKSHRLLSRK